MALKKKLQVQKSAKIRKKGIKIRESGNSWQHVLTERLINQQYEIDKTTGEIVFKDEIQHPPPFKDKTEHQNWFFAKGTKYGAWGLSEFDKEPTVKGGRKSVKNKINHHLGKDPKTDSKDLGQIIEDTIHCTLFEDTKKDVFYAVRAKLEHVCEECKAMGAGVALYILGDSYALIVNYILKNYAQDYCKSGKIMSTKTQRSEFEKMLKTLKIYKAMGAHKKAVANESELKQYYALAKLPGAKSHDSW